MNIYQQFIFLRSYSKWLDDKKRRETFEETISRYITNVAPQADKQALLDLEIMPSMRMLKTAGDPLNKENASGYNCGYTTVDNIDAFRNIFYLLLCGTGVGYSVEKALVEQLPTIPKSISADYETTHRVKDSKDGWADAVKIHISNLYNGFLLKFDLTAVSPAGTRLKTFGGCSSGPKPLRDLLTFITTKFLEARGRKLTALECHDIICKIATVPRAGGVRRSALICLSDLEDTSIRDCKDDAEKNQHRYLSNNSAVYFGRPVREKFDEEWKHLQESGMGERGIFNRKAAELKCAAIERRVWPFMGTNPCGEILLRPDQFCNLSETVVREIDTVKSLLNKIEKTTILGTIQSSLTNFKYISGEWKANCDEERLLGVSLTGIYDNHFMCTPSQELEDALKILREQARYTNNVWARKLGIPPSKAITCIKPSGTVSQLVNCSSGIHPRFSQYYYRTVQGSAHEPLTKFMQAKGFRWEYLKGDASQIIFYFPIASPEGAVTAENITALQHLTLWKIYAENYCDHNPSCTIYIRKGEWDQVREWVWDNFDLICGLSFLPYDDHIYEQAPYQKVTKEQYEELLSKTPQEIDWSELKETEDTTAAENEVVCLGNRCER